MFNREWFAKYQEELLWLLNTPLIRIWFRWVFCINGDKSSVGKKDILKILPHAIIWKGRKRGQLTAEFRTHNKFSKRLLYAFYPIWWLMHEWDMLVANPFQPRWNLGFDTLTAYPDADPESTTVDGHVQRAGVDESMTTIRSGAGTAVGDDASTVAQIARLVGSGTSNQFAALRRGVFLFLTGVVIGDGDSIDSGTLSLWATSKTNGMSGEASANSTQVLVSSNPASNTVLANADYNIANFGSTSFGETVTQANITTGAYNAITLLAAGLAAISKTGVTKFGTRQRWDLDNTITGLTWGVDGVQGIGVSAADEAGTTQDPKLVVNYTPVTSSIKKVSPVAQANVKKILGITLANTKKISGVANT